MPKIREYNHQECLKLDESFKETLARVRPYVLQLTCEESAELCKVWLHKLNSSSSQPHLRNEYLAELCKQLRTGCIGGIFSRSPPNGRLIPLPKSYHMVCISSSISDLSDYAYKPHRSCLKSSPKCTKHQRTKELLRHRPLGTANTSPCLNTINTSPINRFPNENVIRKDQRKIYEQRIGTLNTTIAELEAQNEYLKHQLSECPENCNIIEADRLYANINQLTSEFSALKAKLSDVQKIKHSLEESCKEVFQEHHYIVGEHFTELKRQLEEIRSKNQTLDNNVSVVSEKIEDIIHGKDEDTKVTEKQWSDKIKAISERFDMFVREKNKELELKQEELEKKDMELSQKEMERRQDIEFLTNKILDLETKLETKIRDEDKLQSMLVEQYTVMKEELNKVVRDEINHETQNLSSQVTFLKKAVVKLEKSKEKLQFEYEKKMFHVIKNKELEIKELQLQLQGQKNKLCTMLNTKKQSEINNVATLLEKRYKTILAETEAMTEAQTKEYLKKIAELESQMHSMKKL